MGIYEEDAHLYDIDKDLLYFRTEEQPKKEKLSYAKETWHGKQPIIDGSSGIGSNCWAVSGEHTQSAKPMLSCDPHLMKWL